MPQEVFTILKYVVLAILYLFFLRVLRAVWVELREPKASSRDRDIVPLPPLPGPIPGGVGPLPGGPGPIPGSFPAAPGPFPVAPPAAAPTVLTPTMPRGGGSPVLAVTDPPEHRGQRFAVDAETTVGRAPGCAVSLPDDTFVSQLHARVFRRDAGLWVEDLGSTNGTFVNGVKVTSAVPLREGDRLRVGNTVLECTGP